MSFQSSTWEAAWVLEKLQARVSASLLHWYNLKGHVTVQVAVLKESTASKFDQRLWLLGHAAAWSYLAPPDLGLVLQLWPCPGG